MAHQGPVRQREQPPSPELADRVKVSGGLGGGIILLTGVIAVAAAFEGGPSRIALNDGLELALTVGAVVLGIGLAWLSVLATTRRWWRVLIALAVTGTLGGLAAGAAISVQAATGYDRPEVTMGYDGATLSFTGTVSLMRAEEDMIVTVFGYPEGQDAGSELFFAKSGPSPEGKATVTGQIPLNAGAFELVEVSVYGSNDDTDAASEGAEASTGECRRNEGEKPAGCGFIYLDSPPPTAADQR
jgi:hypothetical protein